MGRKSPYDTFIGTEWRQDLHGVFIEVEGRGVLHDDRKGVLVKVNEPRRTQSSK